MATLAQTVSYADRVRGLAQFVVDKKRGGNKFVVMLGAGASLSSGIKPTKTIMEELVAKHPQEPAGACTEDAFDKLWRESNRENRELMLEPYLRGIPSEGYARLAELVQRGFFDLLITFNFDRMLETALNAIGFIPDRDYKSIIRGETRDEEIGLLIRKKEPRVKILKLHGSLNSADYFLFSREEMLNYPKELNDLFNDLTKSDVIICGYAFNDDCVIRAFNTAKDGGAIYFVNPSGATDHVKGVLIPRNSQDKVVSGELGTFDHFFNTLHGHLTAPARPTPQRGETARQNLFKFLDHYCEENKDWFFGRSKLKRTLIKMFDTNPPRNLVIFGDPKVGKTSFIRAGFLPYLKPEKYHGILVRCRAELESQVSAELGRCFPELAGLECREMLNRLKETSSKRIILVLDQFERAARFYYRAPQHKGFFDFVKFLCSDQDGPLSVVLVTADDTSFWKLCFDLSLRAEKLNIPPLPAIRVGSVIRHAAQRGRVALNAETIKTLCSRYEASIGCTGTDKNAFTLMHVQTLCYYLAKGYQGSLDAYEMPNQGLTVALRSISEESSLSDLLDELPATERKIIRNFLKVICDPQSNTRQIVEFIKNHFPNFQDDPFPEPIQ